MTLLIDSRRSNVGCFPLAEMLAIPVNIAVSDIEP